MAIPKYIHQIWWQNWENLPEKFRGNVTSVIEKNPNWKHFKWDESSIRKLMAQYGPQYLAKLDEFKFLHQKIDLSRNFLLYHFGGASIDTDVRAIKGLDEIPNINSSSFIVSKNASNYVENLVKNGNTVSLNNATILVSQYNPIMKGLLDHQLTLSCEVGESRESCIQGTTGPKEFTSYLNQYRNQITILDNVYLEPCGNDPHCEVKPQSVLDHRHEGSWVRDSHKTFSQIWYWLKANKIAVLSGIAGIILLFTLSSKTKTT